MNQMRELFLEKFLVPRYGRVIATGYADRLDTPDTLWVQQDCWEAWQAAQSAAVPVCDGNYADGALYKILDDLYERGWADKHKGRDYDPRGTAEWQTLLDLFTRESVPVVGNAVTYTYPWEIEGGESSVKAGRTGDIGAWHISKQPECPDESVMLHLKPPHSISAAELAELREKAAMAEAEQEEKAKFAFKCAALTAELDALRKGERDREVGAAIQRAAKYLPDGYDIHIEIETGAAIVRLCQNNADNYIDIDVDADNRLAAEIHAAIDAAIAGETEHG